MEIELMGWIGEDMSEEEVIAYIDEIEAEEEARIELADMAREGWRLWNGQSYQYYSYLSLLFGGHG